MEGLIPMVFRAIKNSRNGTKYHHLLADQNSGNGSSCHHPLLLHAPACYEDLSGELRLRAMGGQLRRRTRCAVTESKYVKRKDGSPWAMSVDQRPHIQENPSGSLGSGAFSKEEASCPVKLSAQNCQDWLKM